MPLLSKINWLDGKPYLDGSIGNSIPYQRALEQGYDKIVIVATRDKSYVRPENTLRINEAAKVAYRKYPKFVDNFIHRPDRYNKMLEDIRQLEKNKKVFVLRPEYPVDVGYTEDNQHKLDSLYDNGIKVVRFNETKMMNYLHS